jgi:HAD superfamily hydrolase (TIGR01509 family)
MPHDQAASTSASPKDLRSTERHRSSSIGVRGVLLDIDGTLLDSNGAHARAWVEAMEGEGIALPYDLVVRQIGKGGDKLLWTLLDMSDDSVAGRTIARHQKEIFRSRYLADLAPFPQARALLQRMRAMGMSLHVATSATAEEVGDLLRQGGLSDLIHHVTTTDDASRSKPDPDIVEAAIARSGLPRAELIMIGDTPYDVESARAAGVPIVAVRSGGWVDADLAGAMAIYDDVADLLARWDTSPFQGRAIPANVL